MPVKRALDIGCGTGLWQREVYQRYPEAKYVGVETSEYACRTYGWDQGSVIDYQPAEDFDLVVCQGSTPVPQRRRGRSRAPQPATSPASLRLPSTWRS